MFAFWSPLWDPGLATVDAEHLHEREVTTIAILKHVSQRLKTFVHTLRVDLPNCLPTWLFQHSDHDAQTPPVIGEPIYVLGYFYGKSIEHRTDPRVNKVFEAVCHQNVINIEDEGRRVLKTGGTRRADYRIRRSGHATRELTNLPYPAVTAP